jgi:hypothetical protein
LLPALAALLATGCTQPVRTVAIGGRVYPDPPAAPRVQFLTSIGAAGQAAGNGRQGGAGALLFGSTSDPATGLTRPAGLAARDGRLYVCDPEHGDVLLYDFAADQSAPWAHPNVSFSKPAAIRLRDDGNVEVCDAGLEKVFLLTADGALLRAVGLDALRQVNPGAPLPDRFKPVATAPGPNGTSAVLNAAAHRIELIDLSTGRHAGAWPGTASGPAGLFAPTGMGVAAGQTIVADAMTRRLTRLDATGTPVGSIGEPGDAPGYLAHPKGLAVDEHGVIYVVDAALQIVQMFDSGGEFLMSFGGPDESDGGLLAPAGICLDRSCLPHFQQYVRPGFAVDHLVFVSNQMGASRISVYAFGQEQATGSKE